LYYNAVKEKQWSGKLEEKWKGPYYIYEVIINGSYRLKGMKRKILRTLINGELELEIQQLRKIVKKKEIKEIEEIPSDFWEENCLDLSLIFTLHFPFT